MLHSFAYSLDYLREMIADVPDELMSVQPSGIANHPAWTIGHLVFIAQAIGGVAGIEPWLDEDWAKQFGPGSTPGSEPPASAGGQFAKQSESLPAAFGSSLRSDLLNELDTAQAKLTAAINALTDEQLDAPFPDPSYADVFPTVRHAVTQVLLGHTAFHIGQLSVWRRAMSLRPMLRSYE